MPNNRKLFLAHNFNYNPRLPTVLHNLPVSVKQRQARLVPSGIFDTLELDRFDWLYTHP